MLTSIVDKAATSMLRAYAADAKSGYRSKAVLSAIDATADVDKLHQTPRVVVIMRNGRIHHYASEVPIELVTMDFGNAKHIKAGSPMTINWLEANELLAEFMDDAPWDSIPSPEVINLPDRITRCNLVPEQAVKDLIDYACRARSNARQQAVAPHVLKLRKSIANPPIVLAIIRQGKIANFVCNYPVGLSEASIPLNIKPDKIFKTVPQFRTIRGGYKPDLIIEIMSSLNVAETPGINL